MTRSRNFPPFFRLRYWIAGHVHRRRGGCWATSSNFYLNPLTEKQTWTDLFSTDSDACKREAICLGCCWCGLYQEENPTGIPILNKEEVF